MEDHLADFTPYFLVLINQSKKMSVNKFGRPYCWFYTIFSSSWCWNVDGMLNIWKKIFSYLPICFEKHYKKSNFLFKETENFNDDNAAMSKCIIPSKKFHINVESRWFSTIFPRFWWWNIDHIMKRKYLYLRICFEERNKQIKYIRYKKIS